MFRSLSCFAHLLEVAAEFKDILISLNFSAFVKKYFDQFTGLCFRLKVFQSVESFVFSFKTISINLKFCELLQKYFDQFKVLRFQ